MHFSAFHFQLLKRPIFVLCQATSNSHDSLKLTAHIVWNTKYKYSVLKGDMQFRCRAILVQICES